MTGAVRPARGGLGAQNKVTKQPSAATVRRQTQNQHQQQQQLLTAAAVLEQQHQSDQTTATIHHSLSAPDEDIVNHAQHQHTQLHHQSQHHFLITHDSLAGTGLEDPHSHSHANPHDLHQEHHHHHHHHDPMVDLHLPETDDKTEHDDASLHGPIPPKTAEDTDSLLPQAMDLSGADGSLLDGNSSLLDATGGAYDSPPPDSPQDHQSTGAASTSAQHHHPHPHHTLDFKTAIRSTEDLAGASGYDNFKIESALAKRLVKEPGMRHAQQRRPEQILNLQRRSNVEALFAHIAGHEAVSPCKNCRKGHGPWQSCVVVEGQMCGACANCWFNASGARCSFHEARNGQISGLPPSQQHSMQTPSAPSPHDTYGAGSPLNLAPQSHNALPSGVNFTPAINSGSLNHNGINIPDAGVRFTIERSLQEIRGADKRQRQLLKIELTAKQLAMQIVEYEDMCAQDGRQHQHDTAATGEVADGT